jgi:16S rRNA processing protein RimM
VTDEPAFLVVGQIGKPHGTRGELFVEPLTDHPGNVFVPGVVLRPGDARGGAPAGELPPLHIEGVRPFRHGWLVAFEGVDDRNAAELMRGRYLLLERELLPPLADGEVFVHQLIGMEVVTVAGERIGEVRTVFDLAPTNLLEVRTADGTVLVPFREPTVRAVDTAAKRIVIDPPEGLLDL